ncbi:hypothetical protein PA25_22380 [Pseudoalteromonas sp. A25]|uniref:nSTAND1 domain-containing NTPase n=1 Tax=Pseudoalteromonas sp. A25 TaxID=116092 RepID=UPI001260D120|nr:winged helix-turn-helix domain-containing protein [Pseudoalteromonas sp. A25]BBN82253.1 hypothetical protein PA25_22380 [Pseudoalteromonas sp. A25]
MTGPTSKQHSPFYLNNTLVIPDKNVLERAGHSITVQPKQMDVLCYFADHAGELVTSEALIENCWPNQYISDSPLHKCIASLRKALEDDKAHPNYIKTLPKKGYLLVANVTCVDHSAQQSGGAMNVSSSPTSEWLSGNPYPGQGAYELHLQDVFMGRQRFIRQCVTRSLEERLQIISTLPRQGSTSLLQAGLYPAFRKLTLQQSNNFKAVFYCCVTCEPALVFNEIAATLTQLGSAERLLILLDDIDNLHQQDASAQILARLKEFASVARVHWVIPCATWSESQSLKQLQALGLIDDTQAYEQALTAMPAFNYAELYQLISRPFELAGHSLHAAGAIDELILEDVTTHGYAIGLLQRYLQQLFMNHSNTPLGAQSYPRFTFARFLKQYTTQVMQQLSDVDKAELTALFPSLVTISSEDHHQRVRQTLVLDANAQALTMNSITLLVESDLLMPVSKYVQNGTEKVAFMLSCDLLLDEWEMLSLWIERNLHELFLTQDITIAYSRWEGQNRHRDYLLSNPSQLQKIAKSSLMKSSSLLINRNIREYLALSVKKYRAGNRLKQSVAAVLLLASSALVFFGIKVQQQNTQISEANQAAENLISFMLSDLKAKLEPIGKLELLSMVANQALQYFADQGSEQLSQNAAIQLADAFTLLGQVAYQKRQFEQAHKLFRQGAQALRTQLDKAPNAEPLLEQQMLNYFWLGQLHYQQEQYDTAQQAFQGYLHNAQHLLALQPDNQHYQLELSYAFNNLGSVAYKQNNILAAEQYFNRSLDLKSDLLKYQPGNNALISDIAGTYSWQGNIQDRKGAIDKALPYYEKAVELRKVIYNKDTENTLSMIRLFDVLQKKSATLLSLGQYQRVLDEFNNSHILITQLQDLDRENVSHNEKSLINTLIELIALRQTDQDEQVMLNLTTLDNSGLKPPNSELSILARSTLKKIELERAYSLANRSVPVALAYLKSIQLAVPEGTEPNLLTLSEFVVFTRYLELLATQHETFDSIHKQKAEQWLTLYRPLIEAHQNGEDQFIKWEIVGHYLLLQRLLNKPLTPELLDSFKASGYRPDEFTLLF